MTDRLRIALAQTAPALGQVEANLEKAEAFLHRAAAQGARVVLFPELYLTGYHLGPEADRLALTLSSPAIQTLQDRVLGLRLTLLMGFVERDPADGRLYDALLYLDPEGRAATYRKTHLFGTERDLFAPGDALRPLPDGIGGLICSDLEFPEAARSLCLQGARWLAVIAALPERWADLHPRLAPVRALENHAFLAWVNRVGEEAGDRYLGGSGVWDPLGREVARASREETLLLVELELDLCRQAREHLAIDYLQDRRPELYLDQAPTPRAAEASEGFKRTASGRGGPFA